MTGDRPFAFFDELEKLWKNVVVLTEPISKMAAEASAQAAVTASTLDEFMPGLERRIATLEAGRATFAALDKSISGLDRRIAVLEDIAATARDLIINMSRGKST